MKDNVDISNSYKRIRRLIGILGLLLPIIIVVFYGKFLPSISLFYYTRSAVFFIAILAAFGLFLISYEGYKKKEGEKGFSDNFLTHLGGTAILLVVLLPTTCADKAPNICDVCAKTGYCLFGHDIAWINIIHLSSAALFFITMGWLSIFNFTKGIDKKYHFMYKICGYTIWASMLILILEFTMKLFTGEVLNITGYDVYILETLMIVSFAVSWLLKGRTIEYLVKVKNASFKMFKLRK